MGASLLGVLALGLGTGLSACHRGPPQGDADKKGMGRKTHTGLSGPATGDHYTDFVAEVKTTLGQLLAET